MGGLVLRVNIAQGAIGMRIDILGGIATLVLLTAPAMAADMPVKARAPIPVATSNWSGFYLGGGVGARWLENDANISAASLGTPPVNILGGAGPGNSFDSTALHGSVFAGWNWLSNGFGASRLTLVGRRTNRP
jgi:opacity protein-like surface antigen